MINYAVMLVYSLVAVLIVVCGWIIFKHEYKEAKRKQNKRDIHQELMDGVEEMAAQREVVIQKGKSLVKSLNNKNRYKRSEYPDKYSKPLYDEHYLEVQDNTELFQANKLLFDQARKEAEEIKKGIWRKCRSEQDNTEVPKAKSSFDRKRMDVTLASKLVEAPHGMGKDEMKDFIRSHTEQDNTEMWEDGRLGRSMEHAELSTIDADEIDRRLGIVSDKQIKEVLGVCANTKTFEEVPKFNSSDEFYDWIHDTPLKEMYLDKRKKLSESELYTYLYGCWVDPMSRDVSVEVKYDKGQAFDSLKNSTIEESSSIYKPDCYERSVPDSGGYSSCDNSSSSID